MATDAHLDLDPLLTSAETAIIIMPLTHLFQGLARSLNEACTAKSHLIAEEAAIRSGLQKSDLTKDLIVRHLFRFDDSKENSIEMEWRSYDQSGPFQNLPDMNKIELRLYSKGVKIDQHQVSYED